MDQFPAQQKKKKTMKLNTQGTLLSAAMLTSLVVVFSGAVNRFNPVWEPNYLIGICLLICLEAGFVHYIARVERMSWGDLARYLVPEIFIMAILMRVAATTSVSGVNLSSQIEQWLYDPLSIIEPVFVLYMLAGLLIGVLTHATMYDLSELAPRALDRNDPADDSGRRYAVLVAADRAAAISRINSRFIFGGIGLLISLGIEAVNLERLGGASLAISTRSVVVSLIYLVSGFLLYSQARLALLQARWQSEGAYVAPEVAHRWGRMSWLLIIGVVGGAGLLPRTYAMGLLDTLRGGLALIGYAVAMIGYVVVWLFGLLLMIPAWLLSLFSSGTTSSQYTPASPPPPPPPVVEQEPNLLAAMIFWLCMFILAGYAVSIVLQRHPGLLRALVSRGPLARLARWLAGLWRDTGTWVELAARAVQTTLRRTPHPPSIRPRFFSLRRLAPRDLIRYFYRSTLLRAAKLGHPRHTGQTPYEYAAEISTDLEDARQDVGELTEAFVVAQYSRREIDTNDARRARRPWERLKARLRSAWKQG